MSYIWFNVFFTDNRLKNRVVQGYHVLLLNIKLIGLYKDTQLCKIYIIILRQR